MRRATRVVRDVSFAGLAAAGCALSSLLWGSRPVPGLDGSKSWKPAWAVSQAYTRAADVCDGRIAALLFFIVEFGFAVACGPPM